MDSDISGGGSLAVTWTSAHIGTAGPAAGAGLDRRPGPVDLEARVTGGPLVRFRVTPGDPAAAAATPPVGGMGQRHPAGSSAPTGPPVGPQAVDASTVPYDPDRRCAVPRNDPTIQAYQPSPSQVEWAADLAAHGELTVDRPANWLNSGLPGFAPQGLFKPIELSTPSGRPGHVPAQVLLGVLAQESNLRQASWHVVDASSGNPLTSPGFYGLAGDDPDPNAIDWSKADCGYGVGQVTTGMRAEDTNAQGGLSDLQQRAVAVDYATNIAASALLLEQKWNELRAANIVVNDGDPAYIENWFFAIWAYNTGLHANTGSGPWGLGWLNNPANPIYPADRRPYLTAPLVTSSHHDTVGYDNAKHPSDWSYPERVMGWARTSVVLPDYADNGAWKSTYAPATWPNEVSADDYTSFVAAQPGFDVACVPAVNHCDRAAPPHKSNDPQFADQPPGPCQQDDLTQCWWHGSASWISCPTACGREVRRYTSVEPRPLATNIHPERCDLAGLPPGALVVDDIATTVPLGPDGCSPVASGGQFGFRFAGTSTSGGAPIYPSKVDFHQLGAGFGGHLWFAHTRPAWATTLTVTGTWTPAHTLGGWTQVLVHLPDTASWTQQAHYVIHTGAGDRDRYLSTNRGANTWILLGTYQFAGAGPQGLELSNVTRDGHGDEDVAWDAAAFVPLPTKPADFVVAMGDSYGSGEGSGSYYPETDQDYASTSWNACRRSTRSWPRLTRLPQRSESIGTLADRFDPSIDFQFVSCSGATAEAMRDGSARSWWSGSPSLKDLHDSAEGQFFEQDQVDSGVLSADTTLVLLSAGGNDAEFPATVADCVQGDCSGRQSAYASNIVAAQGPVRDLIDAVHQRAPNAHIVLVGYPRLFADHHATNCADTALTGNEMDMLNQLARVMKSQQATTVAQANGPDGKVDFVDVLTGFGDHGTCRQYDTAEDLTISDDINGVVIGPTGPGDFTRVAGDDSAPCLRLLPAGLSGCASRSSFHPKDTGAARYADVLTTSLGAMHASGS